MRVRAAEAERTHTGDATAVDRRPRHALGRNAHGEFTPRNVWTRRDEIQMRRNFFVLQRQHELDQRRDAGGRLEMTDIRLERTDEQWLHTVAVGPEDCAECLNLERVAQLGAGTMCFDVTHIARRHAAAGQRFANHCFLLRTIRRGETTAGAILIHCAAADHSQYAIAVLHRVTESLQHHHTAAFSARKTVGRCVKGVTATIGREHARAGQRDVDIRRQNQVHTGGQGHAALAGAQRL